MPVAAASGFAHVQCDFVLSVRILQIEVSREHRGGHVAEFSTNDIPRTRVELFFDAIPCELNDTSRHVFIFVAGVSENCSKPCGFLAELRDIPFVEEILHVLLAGSRHVHHIRYFADCLGAFVEIRFQNSHDLEKIRAKRGDFPRRKLIGFFFWNQFAPNGFDTLFLFNFVL
ncbi:hypothetical protein SDC9_199549 [bioreactor metagenome]|uniref:Uncharacterized protein n=1 Tax=bioreactor metagenome TaxID=1076179 RepID=A0A645IKS4_9ZZZZ